MLWKGLGPVGDLLICAKHLLLTPGPSANTLTGVLGRRQNGRRPPKTVDEAGLPKFYTTVWSAIWAPKGTPKNVIAKLNAGVVDGLSDSALRQRLADLGQQIVPRDQQTPEGLASFHKAELEKWWPIIKAGNMKGE